MFGNLRRKFLFTLVDKGIITFAFIVVSLSVVDIQSGIFNVGYNFFIIAAIVFGTYFAVWLAVGMLTFWSSGIAQSTWMRYGLAALTAVFILWAYPMVLEITFWLFGFKLTTDVETILTWTFVIRFAIIRLLERRYNEK